MKIRIYLKNGTVSPDIRCDTFAVERNPITGEIAGYKFEGWTLPRPLYIALEDISMIWGLNDETD